jgi:Putative adhesin
MPTFDTPRPIRVTLDLGVGAVRIAASERSDTTVEVRPSNPNNQSDVALAGQTRVEFSDGRLLIKAPKGWKRYTPRGGGDSIDVQISLPTGCEIHGDAGVATLHATGVLGACHYRTGVGDINIEQAGPVHLSSGVGAVAVERVVGHAEISTGAGEIRLGSVDGTAVIKGSNGATWIGDISRDLRVVSANGSIAVDHSHAAVVAKTANGDIRLGEVGGGTVVAHTAVGAVEVGIRNGVAAWLDLSTVFGKVYNQLDATGRPESGEASVDVHARSSFGDITVHRTVASMAVAGGA